MTKLNLNYKKMLKDINDLVNTDFCQDTECKLIPKAKPYTQDEAKQMAQLLGRVYSISHCIFCISCQRGYIEK